MSDKSINEKLHLQFYKWNKLLKKSIFEQKMEHIKAVPYRGQGRILRLLLEKGEMSQKDLVIEMDIKPSTVWELVSKLERAGYVEKIANPDDKRGSIIKLTERGEKEAKSVKWSLSNMSGELYSALSEEEKQQLSTLMDKLISAHQKCDKKEKEDKKEDKKEEEDEEGSFDDIDKKLCHDLGVDFKKDFKESKNFFKELFKDLGFNKKSADSVEINIEIDEDDIDIPYDSMDEDDNDIAYDSIDED